MAGLRSCVGNYELCVCMHVFVCACVEKIGQRQKCNDKLLSVGVAGGEKQLGHVPRTTFPVPPSPCVA